MNTKKNLLLVGAAILAIGSASVASAQIVNVQFVGETSYVYGSDYTGQGALVTTGTYWNSIDIAQSPQTNYGPVSLLETDGSTPSADTISLGGAESYNYANNVVTGPSGNNLIDSAAVSYTASSLPAPTFTIGGLTAGDKYNLYLYGASGTYLQGGTAFTIGGTTLDTVGNSLSGQNANTPPAGGWVNPTDYVEFTGVVADGSGDISGSWIAAVDPGAQDGAFNGLQIQSESMSVPEPSVTILLGLGLMTLVALRRARRIS